MDDTVFTARYPSVYAGLPLILLVVRFLPHVSIDDKHFLHAVRTVVSDHTTKVLACARTPVAKWTVESSACDH